MRLMNEAQARGSDETPVNPPLGDATGRAGFRSDRYKEALRILLEEATLIEDERPSEIMGARRPRGRL